MNNQLGNAGKGRDHRDREFHLCHQVPVISDAAGASRDHLAHIKPGHKAGYHPQKKRVAVHIAACAQAKAESKPKDENCNHRFDKGPRPPQG